MNAPVKILVFCVWWLAVFSLIWFLGPFLGIADWRPLTSPTSRIVAAAGLFLLWSSARIAKALMGLDRSVVSAELPPAPWIARTVHFSAGLVAVLAGAGLILSYSYNSSYVEGVREAAKRADEVAAVPSADLDPLVTLPTLNALRAIPGGYEDRFVAVSWLHGFGLNQREKLGGHAASTYRRVLASTLLPRLMLRMEDRLRTGGSSPEYLYEALRNYLSLDSADHYDADRITAWMRRDLENDTSRELNSLQRLQLDGHVAALFAERPLLPLPLDAAARESSREAIRGLPLARRLYGQLKGSPIPLYSGFSMLEAGGDNTDRVFVRKSGRRVGEFMPALYTALGYWRTESLKRVDEDALADERWILGESEDPTLPGGEDRAELLKQVRELYFQDYADAYTELLLDVELAPFSTAGEAADILEILSDGADSPLLLLLEEVARETTLRWKERDAVFIGYSPSPPDLPGWFEGRFEWLQQLVRKEEGQPARIVALLALLQDLAEFMRAVAENSGRVPNDILDTGQRILRQLESTAERQPPMVADILKTAADRSHALAYGGVNQYLDDLWSADGSRFCRQAISARYPVERASQQEIALVDFSAFFRPGGKLDSFFQDYLQQFVDTSKSTWSVRPDAPIRLSADTLAQFERGHVIRNAFFGAGGSTPSVSFELVPIGMDATISRFLLDLEGKRIEYNHGPSIRQVMQWPGPDPSAGVVLEMSPPKGDTSIVRERGPWAWFRVLDKADIRPAARPEHFEITFEIGGRSARYQLVARSAYNPFRFSELERFRCPEKF